MGSDKLHEDYVYEALNTIITQAKKGPKQDGRMVIDELNGKVEEARAKGVEDDTANKRANEAKTKGKNGERSSKKKGKTPRKRIESSSDEDEENEPEEDEELAEQIQQIKEMEERSAGNND